MLRSERRERLEAWQQATHLSHIVSTCDRASITIRQANVCSRREAAEAPNRQLPKRRCPVHHPLMIPPQRLPASLTPLDVALAALLQGLEPVAPVALPLAKALGCVAASMPPLPAHPPRDIAAGNGWALRARDLVGASSYSPLPLSVSPVWVEAGDMMPAGCDCVI